MNEIPEQEPAPEAAPRIAAEPSPFGGRRLMHPEKSHPRKAGRKKRGSPEHAAARRRKIRERMETIVLEGTPAAAIQAAQLLDKMEDQERKRGGSSEDEPRIHDVAHRVMARIAANPLGGYVFATDGIQQRIKCIRAVHAEGLALLGELGLIERFREFIKHEGIELRPLGSTAKGLALGFDTHEVALLEGTLTGEPRAISTGAADPEPAAHPDVPVNPDNEQEGSQQ